MQLLKLQHQEPNAILFKIEISDTREKDEKPVTHHLYCHMECQHCCITSAGFSQLARQE